MNNKPIRIASLNTRSIFKDANKTNQRLFLSHLRSFSFHIDILCLQEVSAFHTQTRLTEEQIQHFQKFLFPNRSLIVTKYTAIICLNKQLKLNDEVVSMDQRCMAANVTDLSGKTIASIINMYIPATPADRPSFIQQFMDLPFLNYITAEIPGFVLGDFNMNLANSSATDSRISKWVNWLTHNFFNCFPAGLPTFQRGDRTKTTIDYIFGQKELAPLITGCQQFYLPSQWTDHQLLLLDLMPSRMDIGPGFWRFNPILLSDEDFQELLYDVVLSFFAEVGEDFTSDIMDRSRQYIWESFKLLIKDTCERYARGSNKKFRNRLANLEADYRKEVTAIQLLDNRARKSPQSHKIANDIANTIDKAIVKRSQENYLRSATRWHELGERNDKYFYRVIKSRQAQQTIQAVHCEDTGELVTETADILKEARIFYERLYTPDETDDVATSLLLDNIPAEVSITAHQRDTIDRTPTTTEIMDIIEHTPSGKSPGLDGIPFEVYKYLFKEFRQVGNLFTAIMKDAFEGIFPDSWMQTRMVLLYKKGDPTLLSNWRPLSLINTDAKLFTKLLANRFNCVLPALINPYQTGFIKNRLISDNGWVNLTLMDNHRNAKNPTSEAVAVLLDQEKAYDRVHPGYLAKVMKHFGFSDKITSTIQTLFFGTSISISINGFLGTAVNQKRGLRQGDPLSPLLYNLAFEPLLRSILASNTFTGISLMPVSIPPQSLPINTSNMYTVNPHHSIDPNNLPGFKLLSYADDLEVFLSSPAEWSHLQEILYQYGRASNAKVNIQKTEIVSISGLHNDEWSRLAQASGISYHTSSSSNAIRYLGYPLYSNTQQLSAFLSTIKTKISVQANLLKERHLSVRGSSLIANSLLLSQLWHLLRVVPVTKTWLLEIRGIIRKFVLPFWPAPSWDKICLPKVHGGLSVVDPTAQRTALQLIYIKRILRKKKDSDFLTSFIGACIFTYTGHQSFLPWLQYPNSFLKLIKKLPTMFSLTSLIATLPPLTAHDSWSGQVFADTPISMALSKSSNANDNTIDPSKIPIRHLISDVIQWMPGYNMFHNFFAVDVPNTQLTKTVYRQLRVHNSGLVWAPYLSRFMPATPAAYDHLPATQVTISSSSAPNWVPNCDHWKLPSTSPKGASIHSIANGTFRLYLLLQQEKKKKNIG